MNVRGQRRRKKRARSEVREVDEEVDQNWIAAYGGIAKKILKYLEDSEALKVSTRELKEQVLSPDESSVSTVRVPRQARSEQGKKLFQMFRQGASKVR